MAGSFYRASDATDALRQGEILSHVVVITPEPGTPIEEPKVRRGVLPFAVLLGQDCDLSSDKFNRDAFNNPKTSAEKKERLEQKLLKNALLCEVMLVDVFLPRLSSGESADLIKKNDDFRYHCLQQVPAEADAEKEGIPALVVYFKRYLTVPMDDLLARIASGETKRRTYMESPYFEHALTRFANYLGRIGLPENHVI